MLGNFTFCNPTRLYFGEGAIQNLKGELTKYGSTVMLVYGGGSIKKNGIYDGVMAVLKECGKKSSGGWRRHAQPHFGKAR